MSHLEGTPVDLDHLKSLIALFEASSLAEIEVEEEGRRVRLTKPSMAAQHFVSHAPVHAMAQVAPAHGASAPQAAAEPEGPAPDTIESPMVGTFYSAGSPGDPAFVKVGDTVKAGQNVCIIEAMKIMNEVTATRDCVIEKLLVENEQPVEFGQALFEVRFI